MPFADALLAPPLARALAPVACAHCGQPVPRPVDGAREAREAREQFCCSGCAWVYALRRDSELGDDGALVGATATARAASRSYAELDQPEYVALQCRALQGGLLGTE